MGRPTCPQGLLVTRMLTGPALLHLPIVADQSQASWPLCSPPPSPSVSMFLASLHWFSSVTGAVGLGGQRVAMDTASVGHYCIWWPFHHHAPTPPAHQSMSFITRYLENTSFLFDFGIPEHSLLLHLEKPRSV